MNSTYWIRAFTKHSDKKQTQEHGQDISEYPTVQQSWNLSDLKDRNPYATSSLSDNFVSVPSTSRFQDHNTINLPSHSQFPLSSLPAQIIDSSCTLPQCNNGMSGTLAFPPITLLIIFKVFFFKCAGELHIFYSIIILEREKRWKEPRTKATSSMSLEDQRRLQNKKKYNQD